MNTEKQRVEIGLMNPKSPSNVGAVMRAAGCYQANAVRYSGERYRRAAKFNTDTKNVSESIPLTHRTDILTVEDHELSNALQQNTEKLAIVCVDLVEGATPLPLFEHPQNAIYVFGPEDGTISQEVIDKADHVVFVPTVGCMNLAASVNVLLYDRLAKTSQAVDQNALIKTSRDTNNRVSVKHSAPEQG